ncbi:MAG TPA: hypothetical protein VM186_08565 [Planctomycetota bacterium]|nr:hypothetical protein [Planctomycetota bacterium]
MPEKKNCWELKKCGREPGGSKTGEFGPCPASTDKAADKLNGGGNGGGNGGRICWAITGTLCGGKVQGTFAQKRLSCVSCTVLATVKEEEGRQFVFPHRVRRQ